MPVSTASAEGYSVLLAGSLIGVPPTDETPELSLAHEVGHRLHWLLRERGTDMEDLLAVLADSGNIRFLRALRADVERAGDAEFLGLLDELDDPGGREVFARAYAQYIAWRSGDAEMLSQIDDDLGDKSDLIAARHWPYASFLPIALQFDMLFERVGWLTRT